ncbi:calcium/sodium antiporter [Methanohalophilus sp.]|uniref:calcium/sodium antiporter n=1 Tax=Methanohalophilus sp. TaxID=1966352 RepID=UPI002604FB4B|nr:calcium/sodium antiporter [Methanohalophilus sp.]MDK2891723.1 cation:H+ antiporter [Methanohalophilus sp.]
MIYIPILFILSFVLITKGADWFVESAVEISTKSGIPKVVIGATIVSFATTSPEFTVSAYAAYLGQTDMTVGNAVGSAICNIGLILGAVISLKAIEVTDASFLQRGAFMLVSGIILLITSLDGNISWIDGLIMLLYFAIFLYFNYRSQSSIFIQSVQCEDCGSIRKDVVYFLGGAISVVVGSRILIYSGTEIAYWLGIPEMIIALTLVAFGTSLPELITAISATMKNHQELTIGNIFGANTMDIVMILGFSSQLTDLPIGSQSLQYDFPVMLVIMAAIVAFGLTKHRFDRWEGFLILGFYLAYVFGLLFLYN